MAVLLEARPFRPFKSSEEYLIAMKEDLTEWLNALYPELRLSLENFMDRLDTGVVLCKHANNVRQAAADYVARRQARKIMTRSITSSLAMPISQLSDVAFLPNAKAGTFFARDNVSNFISWCRNSLGIIDCLLFESDDLIMRKNERHVILCLLEVARRGAKFGMLAPMLVQMERQIDREIAAENKASSGAENDDTDDEYEEMQQNEPCLIYGPQPQIVTNDLKSLDEMVRDLVEKCTCPTQFPMIRVSEGKYRIGDTKVLIFVRILRSHVMVRVGGGWDTLSHYLDKHDPCRCRTSHRTMISAKLIQKTSGSFDIDNSQVHYERSPPRIRRSSVSGLTAAAGNVQSASEQCHSLQTPKKTPSNQSRSPILHQAIRHHHGDDRQHFDTRSQSPSCQNKFLTSPIRQRSDVGCTSRSRSPTVKSSSVLANTSPSKTEINKSRRTTLSDASGKALNEENRQIKYDDRAHTDHSRIPNNCQDLKKDKTREIDTKIPLSNELSSNSVVEGTLDRLTSHKDDILKHESPMSNITSVPIDSSSCNPMTSPSPIKKETFELLKNIASQYCPSVHDGEHSDNGSEVSDEGYRSLSTVHQPSLNSARNQISPTIIDCKKHANKHSCPEKQTIESNQRKTKTLSPHLGRGPPIRSLTSLSLEDTHCKSSTIRKNKNISCNALASETSRESSSTLETSHRKRHITKTSPRILHSTENKNKSTGLSQAYSNQSSNGKNIKQKPEFSIETHVNNSEISGNGNSNNNVNRGSPALSFSRNNSLRQSLPKFSKNGSQWDINGSKVKSTESSSSLQSTKNKISKPSEKILSKINDFQDVKEVEKIEDVLTDFQGCKEREENLEFTRAWIDGNGTVALSQDNTVITPRKDPRANFSKIPIPIHKTSMSVTLNNA